MKQLNTEQVAECRVALQRLSTYGADVSALVKWLTEREQRNEVRAITDLDRVWPLIVHCTMAEHLSGGERPYLSQRICQGRAYRLTAEQRQVIFEWFNMTCSQEVMIESLVTFESDPRIVREVIIRSEQHIDPDNLRVLNGPRKVTIDKWGEFCSAVRNREVEVSQQKEVDSMVGRVARLLKKAKSENVPHKLRTPGDVAYEWHAKVQQRKVEGKTDVPSSEVNEVLCNILSMRGEDELVALFNATARGSGSSSTKADFEFAEVGVEMDKLMKELGL